MTNQNQHTARNVSAKHMTRIEGWASRKPCIALMGEFSAGKTTLINFLLGEEVLPTRVTATQLPPVWMSYGDEIAHYMDETGRRHNIDQAELQKVPVAGVRYIRLFSKSPLLESMDLLDTPGISDPNIPRQTWEIAAGYVNAVIWCTHSTQAWRESERSAWESLPARLRPYSLLLATRSDKLSPHDRNRVIARLKREAGASFRSILPFSATDAIRACAEAEVGELWFSSGAAELLQSLNEIAEAVSENRKGLLARYSVVEGQEALQAVPAHRPPKAVEQTEAAQGNSALPSTSATIHDMSPHRDASAETEGAHIGGARVLPNRISRPGAGDGDQRRARLSRESADSMLRVVQPDGGTNDANLPPLRAAQPAVRQERPATITALEPLILRNRLPSEEPPLDAAQADAGVLEDPVADGSNLSALASDRDQPMDPDHFEVEPESGAAAEQDAGSANGLTFLGRDAQEATTDYDADEMFDDPLDVGRLIQDMARDEDAAAPPADHGFHQPSMAQSEGGALHLWRAVVASAPQVETVPDVLAMIEGFLKELDARGGLRIHSAA